MKHLQRDVHAAAVSSGWWPEGTDMTIIPEKLCLIHSEISEALEAYRVPEDYETHYSPEGKPEGFGVELADAIIRIFDLAEFLGLDMEQLVREKHVYNQSRSWRHGSKLA